MRKLIYLTVAIVILLAYHVADGNNSKGNGTTASSSRKGRINHGMTKTKKWISKQVDRRFNSVKDKPTRRMLGGDDVPIKEHPYAATILIHDRLWCAGAIVHSRWVLTAAHCVNYALVVRPPLFLGHIKIRVGSKKALSGGTTYNVTLAIRHPNYELEPPPHADVAMLKTATNIEFNSNVMPIRIYRGEDEPYAQNFITTVGWGAKTGTLNAFAEKTTDMTEARLKVRTMEYCELAYQIVVGLTITHDFFCASLRNGTRDACLFDAGAPAVQDNMLMGIMSFGPESCGDDTMPPVFIRAWKFMMFVKKTIRDHNIDEVEDIYTTVSVDSSNESPEKPECVTKSNVDKNSKGESPSKVTSESGEAKKDESDEAKKAESGEATKTESGEAKKAEPGEAEKAEPGEAEKAEPGEAEKAEPGEAEKAEPGEAEKAEPGEAVKAEPGEAEKAEPGEAENLKSGEAKEDESAEAK